ncbi:MAG: hypothetical protein IPM03_06500 [Sulfuritalea sp.]|nr:hypothetical protein [Sulfuritalea sp.]
MEKSTTISTNVDFLRWKYGTHKALASRLKGVVNWKELSDYALGNAKLGPGVAASIEIKLNLPSGWIKRENISLTELSAEDYELVSNVLSSSPQVKSALLGLLKAVRDAT